MNQKNIKENCTSHDAPNLNDCDPKRWSVRKIEDDEDQYLDGSVDFVCNYCKYVITMDGFNDSDRLWMKTLGKNYKQMFNYSV